MTDLTPITALGGTVARSEVFGALTLTEQPDLSLASLSLRKGQGVPTPFGLTLPDVGRAVQMGDYGAFWTGRDQWMIEMAGAQDLAALLKSEVPEASVTEQTDGFAAFDITSTGGAAPLDEIMRKLVNLDPLAFGPGCATRTTLEHIGVFLIRRAEDRLAVIGMRTYAGALWHALSTAARRIGAQTDGELT
ncbi:Sarcosine oxidase gamma subunit [Roseibacterium elongatum DSM 19469]|uniref:Sarcosine oxidase gamma subunit n=1 Tax=Roseicyclus elongatus DSM 19469 TaxID=1294273 RepID=W8S6C1_9RHOB|nr:sarcosine oxidase subunit gamma [Roseibacterium elongatum]AHM05812.1 Sarcosine oxidase gamma subunit [Roseibacterium elongatum DSM 19469]